MFKSLRSSQGFSLVELMIVVAIIGILASVAIPNFQRFQRKARQSEAKNLMSAYYTAEKAFQAEYNAYAGNFFAAGFKPDGALGYRIITGINVAPTDPFQLMNMTPVGLMAGCVSTNPAVCPQTGLAGGAGPADWTEKALGNNVGVDATIAVPYAATGTTFSAGAGGFLGTTVGDHWTINESMAMVNTVSGL